MVIIIGAGISGLSAAWHLQKAGINYLVLESSNSPGGYIKTIQKGEFTLDIGPNSILCDQEILDFIDEVGASKEIVEAAPVSKSRYILKNGRYQKLPDKPQLLLFSSFFSPKTKLAIATELWKKAKEIENETLESFFTRRFSKEIADYALNPFVSGIYAGDPKELLVEETFPILKEYEKTYGSVLKGFIKNKPDRKKSLNFKYGMQTLPRSIASQLQHIRYNFEVKEIQKAENCWKIIGNSSGIDFNYECKQLIITTPAEASAKILSSYAPMLSRALYELDYPPMCVVHSVYPRIAIHNELNGFGSLNPTIENQFTSGCIWTSSIFPYKNPSDKFLFTSFIGGTSRADNTKLEDEEIKSRTHKELSKFFNIDKEPDFQVLTRWNKAIPQYNLKIKPIKKLLPDQDKENIFFGSNWLNGVSLSDCIKKGKKIAEKIVNLEAK